MANTKMLKGIYLFKDFTDSELDLVASIAVEKDLLAGTEVFVRGQKADSFYLILMGSVKLYASSESGDEQQIANLSMGDYFGEIPYLDGGVRTATAQAKETSKILEVKFDKMKSVLEGKPETAMKLYRAWAHFIALRLRSTLSDLNLARETKLRHF